MPRICFRNTTVIFSQPDMISQCFCNLWPENKFYIHAVYICIFLSHFENLRYDSLKYEMCKSKAEFMLLLIFDITTNTGFVFTATKLLQRNRSITV